MPLTTDEKVLALSRDALKVFERLDGGIHPGFRLLHAKGILLAGVFTPSREASSLTSAPHIKRQSTPVTVRFSDFAGVPTVADNDPQNASLLALEMNGQPLPPLYRAPLRLRVEQWTGRRALGYRIKLRGDA